MTHENVDEDPDLRRSKASGSRRKRLRKWITKFSFPIPGLDVRIWYWPLGVAALVLGLLVGWGFAHDWGSSQWGSLSGWFSGLLTASAVTVSLYQLAVTRKDADRRQQEQFDQIAAHRQIDTIAPIWEAIGDADIAILKVTNIVDEMQLVQRQYSKYDPGTADHLAITLKLKKIRPRLNAQFRESAPAILKAELSFTNAIMIVEQKDVRRELNQLKDDYTVLSRTFAKIIESDTVTGTWDHTRLDQAKSTVFKHRQTMVEAVREHLVRPQRIN
ncbi:hypothetical protein [Rhodococcus sp. FH8]|uniref:hypothetical protein n=1 Tax=Rhodococcus sp. FH8 TaxID=1761013 RepID=UPI001C4F14DA|nr:hypothetical protein [Rhodococcus sp. FH8]